MNIYRLNCFKYLPYFSLIYFIININDHNDFNKDFVILDKIIIIFFFKNKAIET